MEIGATSGKSCSNPPPPWHYCGWLLNVELECDPAGAADTSHGTEGAVKILRERGIQAEYVADSNSPAVRLACVERIAVHDSLAATEFEQDLSEQRPVSKELAQLYDSRLVL